MLKYLLLTTDIYKIIVFSVTSYPCEQNWKRTDTLPIHLSGHLDVYLNKMNYITHIYHKMDFIVSSITVVYKYLYILS